AFERHDGYGAGIFSDARLLRGDHVHDDAALEHFGHTALDAFRTDDGVLVVRRHGGMVTFDTALIRCMPGNSGVLARWYAINRRIGFDYYLACCVILLHQSTSHPNRG